MKKRGRKQGVLLKLSDELRKELQGYLHDRTITQAMIQTKYGLSSRTVCKYVQIIKEEEKNNRNCR